MREILYFFLGILIAYMGDYVIRIYFSRYHKRGLMSRVDIFRDTPHQENFLIDDLRQYMDYCEEQKQSLFANVGFIKRRANSSIKINPVYRYIPTQQVQAQIQPLKHRELF